MKYKAVVSDLDGTLLNSEHTISHYTRETIKKIVEKGVKFFIATGRHHQDVMVFKNMLDLETYLITSNGARIHNERDEEIYTKDIPAHLTDEILSLDIDNEITKHAYIGDEWVSEIALEGAEEFHKESGFTQTIISFDELKGKEVIKFFFISENVAKIKELEEQLRAKYSDKLNITLSLETCLEIMHKEVSKGTAITELFSKENIEIDEIMAFGDGLNDFEMLKLVGKGLIMGNGNLRLKEALPDNEVIGTNDEHGVARYLEGIFLK